MTVTTDTTMSHAPSGVVAADISEGALRRLDIAGLVLAIIMTLGPLLATALFAH